MGKILIMSLKRLYESGELNKAEIKQRVENGKITEDEYQQITRESLLDFEKIE